MQALTLYAKLILLAGSLLLMAGCATEQDSDLPWNTPQSWEGSPTIPGMPQYK